jgi:hypothetical protein
LIDACSSFDMVLTPRVILCQVVLVSK